jgi:hypothetical protein
MRSKATATLLSLSTLVVLAGSALGQEGEKKPVEKQEQAEGLPLIPAPGTTEPSAEDKMAEIIERLESNLRQVEELLLQSTLGGAEGLQQQIVKDLDELLRSAGQGQSSVLSDIDELIATAPQCNGGGQGSPSGTPKQKQKKDGNESEQEKRQREARKQPTPGQGEKPEDGPEDQQQSGEKRTASNDPGSKQGSPEARPDILDRWGTLPPLLKERIANRNFTSFPPEYREKLMKYYKRLNDEDR